MTDMPRPRPPYLHREITRHGRIIWYVRINRGDRIRLRAVFGTEAFWNEYQAAVGGQPYRGGAVPSAAPSGTLAWLLGQYRADVAWATRLRPGTRRQRESIFQQVLKTAGEEPFGEITQDDILAGRDRRAHTPGQARSYLQAMRGLFRWAKEAKHVRIDPTADIPYPQQPKNDGFRPWSEDDYRAYEARWRRGTRQRVWLDVLAYTGLRRSDAVRLGPSHVRAGEIKTEKTGTVVPVFILPELQCTLDAGPVGDLTFIVSSDGLPFTKESFGNAFKKACKEAGVAGSAHGVRKLAANRAVEVGVTDKELNAMMGWEGTRMAGLYTKAADNKRLARSGMAKLEKAKVIPLPTQRGKGMKAKTATGPKT